MTARLRRLLPWLLLGVALLVAGLLTAGEDDSGLPLDPSSTGPLGVQGLVDVLQELGARVEVGMISEETLDGADTALLLRDQTEEPQRELLQAWVRDGRTLVVADDFSELAPELAGATGIGPFDPTIAKECSLGALADVQRVDASPSAVYETGDLQGAATCFPRNEGAWLVATPSGDGAVVALGGPLVFTNERLGEADNARLAAALLAPGGDETVAVLQPGAPGGGELTLTDLVDPRIWAASAQLAFGFLLYAWYRARRLGEPVSEPLPVAVPGSEFTLAVGRLLQERGDLRRAASTVREGLRGDLARRLGLGSDAAAQRVVADLQRRDSPSAADAESVLEGPLPRSESELVTYVRRAARVGDLATSPGPEQPTVGEERHG